MQDINSILSEVKLLSTGEQLSLLEKLVVIIRKQQTIQGIKLSSISGLGSDIWTETDIDKYIETEREW